MDKVKRYAIRSSLYIVLFLGACIVLLPLFWMILTACKQPGKALDFQFFPSAVFETSNREIPQEDPNLASVTFEYNPNDYPALPNPTKVTVAGQMNQWNKAATPLAFDGKIWTIYLKNLAPGSYEYKFVIDDNHWTPDRARNPEGQDNSSITLSAGYNKNKPLFNESKMVGTEAQFKIYAPEKQSFQVRLINRREALTLTKEGDYFVGKTTILPNEEAKYVIFQEQTFWEGFCRIYTLNNFLKVLNAKDFPFGYFFLNSLIVATLSGLLTVLLCTTAGYAFAKKDFVCKDALFFILLSTMMIPGMIFMVPQYAIVIKLDWINTYMGMIIPHLANIFGLFLLRQHISLIPNAFFEAAIIDGAGEWQMFRHVVIPQSLPIMVTLFLMTFIGQWSNFLWQLIVNTPDSACRTLPVGLALFKGQYATSWETIMAGACFSIIPIALLFLFAQRFFIEGMTKNAIKE